MRSIMRAASFAVISALSISLLLSGASPASAADRSLIRGLVRHDANADRPGEVAKVKAPDFFKDPDTYSCNTTQNAAVTVVYTVDPTPGVWFACQMKSGSWRVYDGPIYGE